ncbi:FbpB family small basic protein [Oceanobacillus sp. 1P07AA]|uniref:FbpB family small basic protein n=1 Tax=Oceanobacillus sp. 1P07AA TaxID=3132293 RepID=UPI0039A5F6B9
MFIILNHSRRKHLSIEELIKINLVEVTTDKETLQKIEDRIDRRHKVNIENKSKNTQR